MTPQYQTMQRVPRVFVLPRCNIRIWATGESGTVGALNFQAQNVKGLRISEDFNEVEEFLTGVPYPDNHHLDARHSVTFDAVWNIGAKLVRNVEHVMEIVWLDASLGPASRAWVRRFYSKVTTSSRHIESDDSNEFGSGNTLKAKYYVQSQGDSGAGSNPYNPSNPDDRDPGDPGTGGDPGDSDSGDPGTTHNGDPIC